MNTDDPHYWSTVNAVGFAIAAFGLLVMLVTSNALYTDVPLYIGFGIMLLGLGIAMFGRSQIYHCSNRVIDEAYREQQEKIVRSRKN